MPTQYPCRICKNAVASNHKATQCDNCSLWVHIRCNKINKLTAFFLMMKLPGTALTVRKKCCPFQN